jgi:hypothetical protein
MFGHVARAGRLPNQAARPLEGTRRQADQAVMASNLVAGLAAVKPSDGCRADAIDRIGGRLILQIASRVAVDCGRARVLEMLESIAAATVEVCSGQARDNRLNDEGL